MNKETLLVPGPTPVTKEIYDALAMDTMGHTDPRFVAIYKNAIEKTKQLFNTDGEVYIVAGSGTLAMEMAIVNTVKKDENILIISHGYFGDRFTLLAKSYGIHVDVIQAHWGKQVDPEVVKEALLHKQYKAVTITHADTSTGVAANLEQLIPLIKESGALAIVDGVVATAAMEEDMGKSYGADESYKIDIVLTGSQKAIGIPPGLAIVAFSKRALEERAKLGTIPAYYTDLQNWRPVMENPSKYFATPPVNLIYAYDVALTIVLEEGMSVRSARHVAFGRAVRAALRSYNMIPLADEEVAAPTLSCMYYPEGIDDLNFRQLLAQKGVIVAGALAHLAGKAFRIGHMGNTTETMLLDAIEKIGEVLQELNYRVDVQHAKEIWVENCMYKVK